MSATVTVRMEFSVRDLARIKTALMAKVDAGSLRAIHLAIQLMKTPITVRRDPESETEAEPEAACEAVPEPPAELPLEEVDDIEGFDAAFVAAPFADSTGAEFAVTNGDGIGDTPGDGIGDRHGESEASAKARREEIRSRRLLAAVAGFTGFTDRLRGRDR